MLRSLIAGYLRSTVQRAAMERLQPGDSAQPDDREPLGPVDLGFVFALGLEARGLVDRLEHASQVRGDRVRVQLGMLAGRRIAVIVSGPGQPAARRATAALLAGHRPRCVISAGLAGGLDPHLAHGDLLLVDRVGDGQGRWLSLQLNYEPSADNPVQAGSLLTVDRVIARAEEKRSLGSTHGAAAVDMETLAVAETCQAGATPLVAVRVISDTADEDLPREVERLLRQRSTAAQAGAALSALARRPQSAADLWKLRNRAESAAAHLSDFLATLVERFPIAGG